MYGMKGQYCNSSYQKYLEKLNFEGGFTGFTFIGMIDLTKRDILYNLVSTKMSLQLLISFYLAAKRYVIYAATSTFVVWK